MTSERRAIERRRAALQEQLRALSGEPLMRGSLYERRRRCGRPSCACATHAPARHASAFLTVFWDGRTRGLHVRPEDAEQVQQAIAAYQRLWELVNELTACEIAELRRRGRERPRAGKRTRR